MEEEAEKLKEMQTEVDKQMNMSSPTAARKFIEHLRFMIMTDNVFSINRRILSCLVSFSFMSQHCL